MARRDVGDAPPPSDEELELIARRDRLTERFALMQAELGGVFYEMAIRDHVRMDVLTRRAAELQRVDAELAETERALRRDDGPPVGYCSDCGAPYGVESHFCSQCGHALASSANGSANGSRTEAGA
ncbi:MAG TPA: hypothetical protein VF072_03440 [Thermoleophilaceae bacterium]